MKTDRAKLGREALERLWWTAGRADEIQERMLLAWLRENRDTAFGRRYGFGELKDVQAYQKRVPLSTYADYEKDIWRIIAGEAGVLTAQEAVCFCISSGTVGDEKYIPLTEADLEMHYIYMYGAVFGQVREYYRELPEEEVFGKIFQIGEFGKTYMPDGRMKGIRSTCVYQWLDEKEGFDVSDHCAPREILFPDVLEDMLYVKVRFALAERDLTAIHGVFINRVVGVVDYILQNWDLLLRDMEVGTVSAGISGRWRRFLCEKLPPDPARAKELRGIRPQAGARGIIGKIWRKMRYIMAIGGGISDHTKRMGVYAGDIPIHHFVYAASEGVFALAEGVGQKDRYILLPESVFFEFIPMDDAGGRTVLMGQLETGKRYGLVVTDRCGLYRYRMGDVIQVVGWYERAPVVKFCYRQDQVIDLAGEKSNQQQFDDAVERLVRRTGVSVRGYCVQGELRGYLFYMECEGFSDGADIFEECLCAANPQYRACRRMGELGPVHVEFLREGSFREYEKRLAGRGKPMAQQKIPHFLDTEEKKVFFAARVLER